MPLLIISPFTAVTVLPTCDLALVLLVTVILSDMVSPCFTIILFDTVSSCFFSVINVSFSAFWMSSFPWLDEFFSSVISLAEQLFWLVDFFDVESLSLEEHLRVVEIFSAVVFLAASSFSCKLSSVSVLEFNFWFEFLFKTDGGGRLDFFFTTKPDNVRLEDKLPILLCQTSGFLFVLTSAFESWKKTHQKHFYYNYNSPKTLRWNYS